MALYGGATGQWEHRIKTVENISLEEALNIAREENAGGFFYNARGSMVLGKVGRFPAKSATFFDSSMPKPWLGGAKMCDYYKMHDVHVAPVPEIGEGYRFHWKRHPGAAMFDGADWGSMAKVIKDIDLKEALEYAMKKFYKGFFYCYKTLVLTEHGTFPARTAVFFKTGEPWLGGAPQCDFFTVKDLIVS